MEMDVNAMQARAGHASKVLAAMANDKRLLILCQLVAGECSVGELVERLQIRQPTISQHLALLRKKGLVTARRDAQTQYYSLASAEVRTILQTLYELYCV